ncbi:MAG: hypothetical protein ABSG72_16125 [Candidatus Sulfotelmatobacter sp.]|jgi:hypothetical protein
MHRKLTLALVFLSTFSFAQSVNVLTRHNNNQHTTQNLQETILTPTNVNSSTFGKLFSYPVDGQIYAEPLYVQGLTMANGTVHNVVFVATEYDSVYAFDADSAALNPNPLWHTNFLNPSGTPSVTPVPCSFGSGICQLFPIVGITGTPVINLASNSIYFIVRTQETTGTTVNWVIRLHALNITSGAEQAGSPVVVCSATGNLGCELNGGGVVFGPGHQQSRPGIILVPETGFPQGVLFIGFAGDSGWVLAYNPTSLALLAAFYTDTQNHTAGPPNAQGVRPPGIPGEGHSGIWGAGGAVAADTNGYIYATTGDGYWDGVLNWGDSLVKLQFAEVGTTGTYSLTVADYFTTSDQACRYAHGLDYGSAGPMILPTQTGSATPNLIWTTGKAVSTCENPYTGYVINADNMGHTGGQFQLTAASNGGGERTSAFWATTSKQYIYNGDDGDPIRAFTLSTSGVSDAGVMATTHAFDEGTSPAISANGTTNGIVWAIEQTDDGDHQPTFQPAVLHAFNATDLTTELYNSAQAPNGRDVAGPSVKMQVPMIVNGKVYVGTQTELDVYGLCPCNSQ